MILDDPTSSLDNKVTQKIMDTILTDPKWSRKTYVISTRKAGILERFDKVIFMEEGEVKFYGKYSEFRESLSYKAYEKHQQHQQTHRETKLNRRTGQNNHQIFQDSNERDLGHSYRLKHSIQELPGNSRKFKKHSRKSSKHASNGLRSSDRDQLNSQNRPKEFNISIHSLGTLTNRNAQSINGFRKEPGKKKV